MNREGGNKKEIIYHLQTELTQLTDRIKRGFEEITQTVKFLSEPSLHRVRKFHTRRDNILNTRVIAISEDENIEKLEHMIHDLQQLLEDLQKEFLN